MIKLNTIGNRIEYMRTKKRMTQAELAALLKVKRETIYQWESGARDLKTGAIQGLSRALNVSADWLLGLSGVKTYNLSTQSLHNATGLSERAIENLRAYKKADDGFSADNPLFKPHLLINALLEDEEGGGALFIICSMVSELLQGGSQDMSEADRWTMDGGRYWACENALTKMIKELVKRECRYGDKK